MEEDVELETIDVENMTPKQQEMYERRMRVFENRFKPKAGRLSYEELAKKENVTKLTIDRDILWLKKRYPHLWSGQQVDHGFAYTMVKISKMYEIIIDESFERFQTTSDWEEKIKIITTLDKLMPTYTNSKAHGTVLKKIKDTADMNKEGTEGNEKAD